tara:strand:+ start:2407 stop:3435 length:1029 start_codon:yes stop_codon:yes gene_type:complete
MKSSLIKLLYLVFFLILYSLPCFSSSLDSKESYFNTDGKLIISNYPEELTEPGVLLNKRIFNHSMRFMYYHKNSSKKNLKIAIIIENTLSSNLDLNYIFSKAGPTEDGLYAGHISTKSFFETLLSKSFTKLSFNPNQSRLITTHLIKPGQVSTGILEINKASLLSHYRLKAIVLDPEYPQLSEFNDVKLLNYTCGIYAQTVKNIYRYYNFEKPLEEVSIGINPYLEDIQEKHPLKGNYGLLYKIQLVVSNPFKAYKKLNFYFSPTGGLSRGLIAIDNTLYETGLFSKKNNFEPEKITHIVLAPYEQKTINILTMPQAGSFYPVHFVIQSNEIQYKYMVSSEI